MKLLFVCYELPSYSDAGSLRVLHSIRFLSRTYGHDISLIAFRFPQKDYVDMSDYCHIKTIEISSRPGMTSLRAVIAAMKSIFSMHNLFSPIPSFLKYAYSRDLDRMIDEVLEKNKIDIIIIDTSPMLCYGLNKKEPVVLLEAFAESEIRLMEYNFEKNWLKKMVRLLYYYQTKGYAKAYRDIANISIAVSKNQMNMVKSNCPDINIAVVPFGIDIDYFRKVGPEQDTPCLIITGTMYSIRNRTMVLYFYDKIYHLIKAKIPEVMLYIVGAGPGKEIMQMAADKSVVVTGFVKDLRPYLSLAWVVVAPFQENFGVKVRILQAMAMGKPVVSNENVNAGIDVSHEENIILAENPEKFAEWVIILLRDKQLREKIGINARKLMEKEYSWEKTTDKLNNILENLNEQSIHPA